MDLSTMLRFKDLSKKLGNRSRSAIYADINEGRLPPPLKFGKLSYWDEAEVEAHMQSEFAKQRAQREAGQ